MSQVKIPKRLPQGRKTASLHMRISPELKDWLERLAPAWNRKNVSELVDDVLEQWVIAQLEDPEIADRIEALKKSQKNTPK